MGLWRSQDGSVQRSKQSCEVCEEVKTDLQGQDGSVRSRRVCEEVKTGL